VLEAHGRDHPAALEVEREARCNAQFFSHNGFEKGNGLRS
jgi:hypothetical protein